MNPCFKIALIGAGYWGKNFARNLSELNALHSICDSKIEAASAISLQFGVPVYSFEQILEDDSVQALAITTNSSSHFKLAEMALKANKHVFIEKPFVTNLEDAMRLKEIVDKTKRKLMVGHLLQYHPVFVKLKELVHQNVLGEIQYIYSNRLDFGKFYSEESVVLNLAPHDVSMILSLTNMFPSSVKISSNEVNTDCATINLSFPNKMKAHVFVSRLSPFKKHKLVVVGSKIMAVFDDVEPDWNKKLCLYPYIVSSKGKTIEAIKELGRFVEVERSEPLRNECMHFIECISKNETPLTDIIEAINVMRVLCAS